MRIYCGNLPFSATESEVRELFERHGRVIEIAFCRDPNGRFRGFCFIDFDGDGPAAISALNGSMLGTRYLTVNQAKPRPEDYLDGK